MHKDNTINKAVVIVFAMCIFVAVILFLFYSSLEKQSDKAEHTAQETKQLVIKLEHEAIQRRNASCQITERDQRDEVRSLEVTYDYLVGLTDKQRQTPLNKLIIKELPRAESEAKRDNAPKYCDEPGVGLPEPDKKVPERPEGL